MPKKRERLHGDMAIRTVVDVTAEFMAALKEERGKPFETRAELNVYLTKKAESALTELVRKAEDRERERRIEELREKRAKLDAEIAALGGKVEVRIVSDDKGSSEPLELGEDEWTKIEYANE